MKPIAFSATITKKTRPVPVQTPAKRAAPPRREIPLPARKTPPSPSVPASAQPVRPQIDQTAFYRFPPMENIIVEAPRNPVPPTSAPQLRTYAALKTAKQQHEQILARIRK